LVGNVQSAKMKHNFPIPILLICLILITSCQPEPEHHSHKKYPHEIAEPSTDGRPQLKQGEGSVDNEIDMHIEEQLADTADISSFFYFNGRMQKDLARAVKNYYRQHNYASVWHLYDINSTKAENFLTYIGNLHQEGLEPEDYQGPDLRKLFTEARLKKKNQAKIAAQADIQFTATFLTVAYHLRYGKVKPRDLQIKWYINKKRRTDFKILLQDIHREENPSDILNKMIPAIAQYQNLKKALKNYHFALLESSSINEDEVKDQIITIKINMERLRWMNDSLGDKNVLVDIPSFTLTINDKKGSSKMKVITGKEVRSTPFFSDEIEYMVFSPYWNVPHNLAVYDILPKIKRSKRYFYAYRFEIFSGWGDEAVQLDPGDIDWQSLSADNFPYRLRQRPGPRNAMGKVKFMFPNIYNIYLHDTPERHLFEKERRDFSSGCIRVENPELLATFLMPELTPDNIKNKMNQDREKYVNLNEKVPVHLVYFTAEADSTGDVIFREDIYNLDESMRDFMKKKVKGDQ
jgi:murein L,D-transpeptidase YcbB/YkuD